MFKKIGKLFLIKPENIKENITLYKELSFVNFLFFKEHFEEDFNYFLSNLREKLELKFLAVDQEGGRVCRIEGDYDSPLEIAKEIYKRRREGS